MTLSEVFFGGIMNFDALLKARQAWSIFTNNHPKFPMFIKAVSKEGIKEGTIISVSVETPEGKKMDTNIKVTESDLQLFEMIKGMGNQ